MCIRDRFINTLESKAPAGAGALSLASTPAVNMGTNPNLTVKPVKTKRKDSRNQNGFKLALCANRFLNDKSSEPAFWRARLKNRIPMNMKVTLIAQMKTYFQVPSSASLFR